MSNAARRDAPPGNQVSHHASRGLVRRGRLVGFEEGEEGPFEGEGDELQRVQKGLALTGSRLLALRPKMVG